MEPDNEKKDLQMEDKRSSIWPESGFDEVLAAVNRINFADKPDEDQDLAGWLEENRHWFGY